MINLAIALAFGMSFIFSPGKLIISKTIGSPLLQSLPSYQGHLILAFINYWLPATIIYLLLRVFHTERWIKISANSKLLLTISNILFIIYILVRTAASTIQGGGASFVVASYSPFIILPAILALLIGLISITVNSFKNKDDSTKRFLAISAIEYIMITAFILTPIALSAIPLYLLPNAPFKLAYEADNVFDAYCKNAGEKIYEVPQYVESIYLDPDGGAYFDRIKNGVYQGWGSGMIGEALVNSGMLLYFEKKNDRDSKNPNAAKYRKYILKDWKGVPIDELTSDYSVTQKTLVSEEESKNLKITGKEVSIENLKTGKVIATLTYFTSSTNRRICGQTSDGDFGVADFIKKALNLKKQFPDALKK